MFFFSRLTNVRASVFMRYIVSYACARPALLTNICENVIKHDASRVLFEQVRAHIQARVL